VRDEKLEELHEGSAGVEKVCTQLSQHCSQKPLKGTDRMAQANPALHRAHPMIYHLFDSESVSLAVTCTLTGEQKRPHYSFAVQAPMAESLARAVAVTHSQISAQRNVPGPKDRCLSVRHVIEKLLILLVLRSCVQGWRNMKKRSGMRGESFALSTRTLVSSGR